MKKKAIQNKKGSNEKMQQQEIEIKIKLAIQIENNNYINIKDKYIK